MIKQSQSDVCRNVAERVRLAVGEELVQLEGGYRLSIDPAGQWPQIKARILPVGIRWVRFERSGETRKTHTVDIVFFGKIEGENEVEAIQTVLEKVAAFFMSREPANMAANRYVACIGVETVPGADPGYDRSALYETPMMYLGGLRITLETL